jgi:hypothetical protein
MSKFFIYRLGDKYDDNQDTIKDLSTGTVKHIANSQLLIKSIFLKPMINDFEHTDQLNDQHIISLLSTDFN